MPEADVDLAADELINSEVCHSSSSEYLPGSENENGEGEGDDGVQVTRQS